MSDFVTKGKRQHGYAKENIPLNVKNTLWLDNVKNAFHLITAFNEKLTHHIPWKLSLSRHCGRSGFPVLPEQTIDLIHNVAKFIIGICGRQFELHNEPVHLVDADGDGHTLLNSVFDQTLCVQHHLGRGTQRSGLYRTLKNADTGAERVQEWAKIKKKK